MHAIIAGCVRPQGPPPRALTAPEPIQSAEETLENGGTVIEEVPEEPLLFPPEVIWFDALPYKGSYYDSLIGWRVPMALKCRCKAITG